MKNRIYNGAGLLYIVIIQKNYFQEALKLW